MPVVECKDVSIRYKTGDLKAIGLKDYVLKRLTGKYKVVEFWADRDINFMLEKGDMLGIVGTNGAGKSTLLKAVTGIMIPTKGSVTTKGNVAALLELASGFDGELTVRENTYLRGALLGYTKEFMDEKYDEIIAFAELENFQEYMFKQLSSGMKSRLAFSIACLVEPDILILDEVLSVGDEGFKAFWKTVLREFWCPTLFSRFVTFVTNAYGWTMESRWRLVLLRLYAMHIVLSCSRRRKNGNFPSLKKNCMQCRSAFVLLGSWE